MANLTVDLDATAREVRIQLDNGKARYMALKDEGINRLDSFAVVMQCQMITTLVLSGLAATDAHNLDRFRALQAEAIKLAGLYRTELEVHLRSNGNVVRDIPVVIHQPTGGVPNNRPKHYVKHSAQHKARVYLKPEDVRAIRKHLDEQCGNDCTWPMMKELATMYNVTAQTIWSIYKRDTYSDLK